MPPKQSHLQACQGSVTWDGEALIDLRGQERGIVLLGGALPLFGGVNLFDMHIVIFESDKRCELIGYTSNEWEI